MQWVNKWQNNQFGSVSVSLLHITLHEVDDIIKADLLVAM